MKKKNKKNTSKKKGEKMEIKVSEIKQEIDTLSQLIEEYELTYLNLYNVVNNMSFNWEDGYANLFFSDVEKEKLKVKNTIDEIKSLKDIYAYIVNKYITLGNEIKFDLRNKNNVLNKMDNCIIEINNIIKSYEGLNLSEISSEIINSIEYQLKKIKENKLKLEIYRKKLKTTIDFIEDVERNVNLKISNIKIEIIKEQNVEDFV